MKNKNAIVNKSTNSIIANKIVYCTNTFSRGTGLMFRSPNVIQDCGWIFIFNRNVKEAITMAFVSFPIDTIFLDKDKRVVEIGLNLKPWGFYNPKNYFYYLIELEKGTVSKTRTKIGDIIDFKG